MAGWRSEEGQSVTDLDLGRFPAPVPLPCDSRGNDRRGCRPSTLPLRSDSLYSPGMPTEGSDGMVWRPGDNFCVAMAEATSGCRGSLVTLEK